MIRSQKGFTFIELLIALAIFSAIATSLYFNFHTGAMLYTRITKDLKRVNDFRLCFAKIEKELHNAVSYGEISFVGEKKVLTFASIIDVYDQTKIEHKLAEVSYLAKGKDLIREVTVVSGEAFDEKAEKDKVLTGISMFQFEYAFLGPDREIVWKDDWSSRDEGDEEAEEPSILPQAVRFSFQYPKDPKKQESIKPVKVEMLELQKTVYLPQGQWKESVIE